MCTFLHLCYISIKTPPPAKNKPERFPEGNAQKMFQLNWKLKDDPILCIFIFIILEKRKLRLTNILQKAIKIVNISMGTQLVVSFLKNLCSFLCFSGQ